MYNLSVILPIFNVESYLPDCLDSLLKSMSLVILEKNIEVVLVNDGSTDQSANIAKDYSSRYNFIYLDKENGGLSDARNHGLQYATGDYVTFIDSDDKITENYFSSIFKAMENHPDLIIFDWYDFFDEEPQKKVSGMDDKNHLWSVQPSAWNKVYKRQFFLDIKFPKGKVYEDVGTVYKILSKVKVFNYIEQPLYMYRKGRQNSLLTTINPKINHIYDVLEDTYQFYRLIINTNQQVKDGLCYQYVKLLMWSNMYRQLKYYKYDIWGYYKKMKETRNLINKRFPDWKSNELIEQNSIYFIDRFGENYINTINSLGKNYSSTLYTLFIIITKNYRRK